MIIMHTESNKCRHFYHMKKKDPIFFILLLSRPDFCDEPKKLNV